MRQAAITPLRLRRAPRPSPTGETVPAQLIDAARRGEQQTASRLVLAEIDKGLALDQLVEAVLVPVLAEIGERWEAHRWAWSDEHVATTTIRRALDAVGAQAGRPVERRGKVAVACAEGDWHSLPALLLAECLTCSGWDAVFLGPSATPERVTAALSAPGWHALVVTCSVPAFLGGVPALAGRAHDLGVAVLIGGAAVTRYRVATALGADAEVATVADAAHQLEQWASKPPTSPSRPARRWAGGVGEVGEVRANDVAAQAVKTMERDASLWPAERDRGRRDLLVEHLGYAVRVAAASAALGQPAVFDDFAAWMWRMLAARGVQAETFLAAIDALRAGCEDEVAAMVRWSGPG